MSMSDWRKPAAPALDIPIQRDSIGAMGALGNQYPDKELTKRYVYRGWGYDLFDPANDHLVRRPEPFIHPEEVDEVAKWLAEERKPKPKKRKPKKRKPKPRYVYTPPAPFKLHLVPPLPPEPEPEPEPQYRREVAPAPGWKPLTGADIDGILGELE